MNNVCPLHPSYRALLVFLGGLAAGLALWLTGADIQFQAMLWLNYSQHVNDIMRLLGDLGLGRSQLILCIVGGVVWALLLHIRDGEGRKRLLLWRLLLGTAEQLWLWSRARWRWASCWENIPFVSKILLAVVPLLALSGLAQLILKFVIGRPRPKELFWNAVGPFDVQPFHFEAGFWSFPSGHATSTFALVVWLALWFPRYRIPLLALGTLLAASRFLAVTPHYLGDVVAGCSLGAAVAIAVFGCMGGRHRA